MSTESSKKSNTLPIIILAILGAIAVFAISAIIGNIFRGGSTPPPVVPPTPAPGVPAATANTYINVRTGPSVQYPILGIAPPGSSAEIIGKSEDGGWWVVKIPTEYVAAGEGWVSDDYVKTRDTGDVPVVPAP